MQLVLGGGSLPLSQVGLAYCILQDAVDFEPTAGEIVIVVDGRETRVPAYFPQGASAADPCVPYVAQSPAVASSPVPSAR